MARKKRPYLPKAVRNLLALNGLKAVPMKFMSGKYGWALYRDGDVKSPHRCLGSTDGGELSRWREIVKHVQEMVIPKWLS